MDDKQLTLNISGRVHKDLRNAMALRALAEVDGGIVCAFVNKILRSLEHNEESVDIKYKPRETSEGAK